MKHTVSQLPQDERSSREMEALTADIFEAAGEFRRRGDALASLAGQTQARWQVLWVIAEGERLTVPQVARRLGLARQSVQRVVNELAGDGVLRAEENPDHKRSLRFSLTRTGADALAAINEAARDWNELVAAHISPRHLAITRRTLQEVTRRARDRQIPGT